MYLKFKPFLFLILVFAGIGRVIAQKLPEGPQVLTFYSDVDDTEQPYGLYLPRNFDEKKRYPLVIMLHGAGSNHRLALKRVFGKSNLPGETDVEASRYFPKWRDVDYIVASPYARGTMGYQGIPEKDVLDVLADVKRRFLIDEDRTYLTGLSMGGGGTLWIGLTRPDIWAAIAPVCPAPPKGTQELAINANNFPIHFFHGDQDPAVNVKVSRESVQKLRELGTKVEYHEYPGVMHNSWENAYKDGYIFDWFSKFTRNPFPERVRYASSQYKYNKAYWLRLDELTPGTRAEINAEFSAANRLSISTQNLSAFSLLLAGHPKFKKEESLQIIVDGIKLKSDGKDSISILKKNNKWIVETTKSQLNTKTKGSEGPVKEAFADRHVYVYGTLGNPTEEEQKLRIKVAEEAANWSVYRGSFLGRIMVFPRVIADKEVRESDFKTSNLILFGTKETNSIIDTIGNELPIQLDSAAKDLGLLYVYPLNGRYVVISSGIPWWQGADTHSFYGTPNLSVLSELKDYIVFKNSVKNVLIEGYFDRSWKISEADTKKLSKERSLILKK